MAQKRKVEIFSAGCALCDDAVAAVRRLACPSCDVEVLDMRDAAVAARVRAYGLARIPAVVVDGKVAACCTGGAVSEDALSAAGIGAPLP
jgi:hypothetical protein